MGDVLEVGERISVVTRDGQEWAIYRTEQNPMGRSARNRPFLERTVQLLTEALTQATFQLKCLDPETDAPPLGITP